MLRPVAILALTLTLACGREVVFVDPPPASSRDTTGTDTTGTDTTVVQRVDLQVTVTIAPADTALARRLGLANGRLSNAQVTARRVAGQQAQQAGTTGSLGQVTLPQLIEGVWAITAGRALTQAERVLLDSANADVTGFGGATQFLVSATAPATTIEAVAGRQGTLVISEAYTPAIRDYLPIYQLGHFVEVHNNSFDTLYLDGKILGISLPWVFPITFNSLSCADLARWLEDPEGIWTSAFWAFPGSGRSHPLPPGASAALATDAIDHRGIRSDLLDLSSADFEFIGTDADVDNPAVPNMEEFPGFSDYGDDILGHGLFWASELKIFLAEPVVLDSLVRDNLPVRSPLHVRIPADHILDVLTSSWSREHPFYAPDYCPHFVHPRFDGQFAELVDESMLHSITRKVLAGSPPGLRVLQRTKVSAVDFEHAPPTPGRVQ